MDIKAIGEIGSLVFIKQGAEVVGEIVDAAEELDASSSDNHGFASILNRLKRWFLSHAQYLSFFTILVLASVPNPLFDLTGIMRAIWNSVLGVFFRNPYGGGTRAHMKAFRSRLLAYYHK
ncbi:hypothetical protein HanLR1_Chr15g0561471 [Helianthus annuus]|nr:hypothetical protein HanLR1_Chr15g0561471 [Helianthus annuus]